ncbi:MAG: fasciclin domain-containing protein [Breznakibacter sp.]
MKQATILRVFSLLALAWYMLVLPSCADDWDNHYDRAGFDLPEVTLNQYIQSQSNLSIFAQMLKITGYDTIVGASQSFTVWAPTNDALAGVDLNDRDQVLEIVKNHVARSAWSTSGVLNNPIYMINNKYLMFSKSGSDYTFGKVDLLASDIPTKNGLIHVINGYAPYVKNIWEYISRTPGLDSLKKFIDLKTKKLSILRVAPSLATKTANRFTIRCLSTAMRFSIP